MCHDEVSENDMGVEVYGPLKVAVTDEIYR
jgi:hypothetical protein